MSPIGIFDSGIGGLSVAKAIRQQLPKEDLIYIADSRYAPYGEKSALVIQQRAAALTQFLRSQQAKAIVVACNTATTTAINCLRQNNPCLPIIGVEPGIKPAVNSSRNGKVAILATPHTLTTASFKRLAKRFQNSTELHIQACPALVPSIEALQLDNDKIQEQVDVYLRPLIAKDIDTLVLGCTHYAWIRPLIEKTVGKTITVISTEKAIANQLQHRLREENVLATQEQSRLTFYSSGPLKHFQQQIKTLWGPSANEASINSLPPLD